MSDGRATHLLTRILREVEARGGEVVATRTEGRWTAQCIVGATTAGGEDEVAYGHGTLFEALTHLAEELGLQLTAEDVRSALETQQRIRRTGAPRPELRIPPLVSPRSPFSERPANSVG